jgi:hypothetical protein
MPNVGGKKFPYTKQGMKDAEEAKDKMGYKKGGDVKKKKKKVKAPGKTKTAEGKSLKELGMTPSPAPKVPGKLQSRPMNNTSAPVPPTAAQAVTPKPAAPMGGMMPPPAPKPPMGGMGGMGMPPKMPGMKKGGKVKKAKSKSYGHGGKIRGAGIAKKGVKKCKMR